VIGRALSARQLLVAQAAAAGKSNRRIAADLFISVRTVEFHLGQILARFVRGVPGFRGRRRLPG
jgi:DNA-binding NarL/FixJ family response regulator